MRAILQSFLVRVETRFSHEIFLSRLCRYDGWVGWSRVSVNGRNSALRMLNSATYHEPISLSMSNPLSIGGVRK